MLTRIISTAKLQRHVHKRRTKSKAEVHSLFYWLAKKISKAGVVKEDNISGRMFRSESVIETLMLTVLRFV